MRLESPYTFDIFERTNFYESLWNGAPSEYRDYATTKANVFSLASYVDAQPHDWCLTHIDAVPDNFLFYPDGEDGEALQLTDRAIAMEPDNQDAYILHADMLLKFGEPQQAIDYVEQEIVPRFPDIYSDPEFLSLVERIEKQ